MEGGVCGLRDGDDVAVYRALAVELDAADAQGNCWLLQRSQEQRQQTGSAMLGSGESVTIDKTNVEKLKQQIEKAIVKQKDMDKLSKQIEITITTEGLRIELIEDKGGTFFESGSAKLSTNGEKLLGMLAGQLQTLPNHLLIEGHTDAQPYSNEMGYTNWELSADRANAARRLLQQDGVGADQISQVRGYAAESLRVPENPMDPSNRRISLIVQWVMAPAGTVAADDASEKAEDAKHAKVEVAKTVAATTVPTTAIVKRSWMARLRSVIPGKKG
jgi:flagellar motor protein MotB